MGKQVKFEDTRPPGYVKYEQTPYCNNCTMGDKFSHQWVCREWYEYGGEFHRKKDVPAEVARDLGLLAAVDKYGWCPLHTFCD
jgi:hypothetical protein